MCILQREEIHVAYGGDGRKLALRLAESSKLDSLIGSRDKRIGLKPNLVVSRPAEEGATTHPEIVEGLIQYLQGHGFANIAVLEGSWVGDSTAKAFKACGYTALAKKYGVELIDTQKDTTTPCDCAGMEIRLCDSALAVDFMINLPVMKGHCQTAITCALKNNKGVIPDSEKRHFHTIGLHKPIAHLNTVAKNDFILVDAICGDLDFEEGGNPLYTGMAFAGRDPVLVDAFAASRMGYSVEDVPYIGMAEALGVGSASLANAQVVSLDEVNKPKNPPQSGRKAAGYAVYISEDSACSACYAALVRALSRADTRLLQGLQGKIAIGQGFRGKRGACGVGACTAGFAKTVPGCPPAAADILHMLQTVV